MGLPKCLGSCSSWCFFRIELICGKLRLKIDDFSDAPDTGESVLNSGNWSIREIAAELRASQERGAVLPGEALPGAATRSPRRAQEGRLAHGVAC